MFHPRFLPSWLLLANSNTPALRGFLWSFQATLLHPCSLCVISPQDGLQETALFWPHPCVPRPGAISAHRRLQHPTNSISMKELDLMMKCPHRRTRSAKHCAVWEVEGKMGTRPRWGRRESILATLIPFSSLSSYSQCGTRVSINPGHICHLLEVCKPPQMTRGIWSPIQALALSLPLPLVPEWQSRPSWRQRHSKAQYCKLLQRLHFCPWPPLWLLELQDKSQQPHQLWAPVRCQQVTQHFPSAMCCVPGVHRALVTSTA